MCAKRSLLHAIVNHYDVLATIVLMLKMLYSGDTSQG